jgi:hypothetical protein
MKLIILALIIGLLFLGSCNDDPLGPQSVGQLQPLNIGNYWSYSYLRMDTLGVVTDTLKWIEVVDSDTVIGGQRYYSIRDIVTMFFGFKIFYINKNDGLYRFILYGETPSLYFKYPVKQNELVFRDTDTLKVINIKAETITPAGKFYCVVYQHMIFNNSQWYYENTYYCPGIGKIKVETGYTRDQVNNKPNSIMLLEEYKIY